jgi:acyl carrier protein
MSIHLPKLQEIIQDLRGDEIISISPEDRIVDLGMDSLDREEFSMVVEEEFGVKICSGDVRTLTLETATVKDWTDYLDQRI